MDRLRGCDHPAATVSPGRNVLGQNTLQAFQVTGAGCGQKALDQSLPALRRRKEEYPAIKRQAELEGALIYFGDEAAMRSDFHRGTTWAPVGQTPVVKATGDRFSLNLISAISAQGLMRFMTIEGRLNGEKFVEFLRRQLHNSRRPIFLIVDGHPAHRAAVVKRFLKSCRGRLRLLFLPSRSLVAQLADRVPASRAR